MLAVAVPRLFATDGVWWHERWRRTVNVALTPGIFTVTLTFDRDHAP
jgi:hypothetical protein